MDIQPADSSADTEFAPAASLVAVANHPEAFDADRRIAIDLPCWTCQYNLRTLGADATCPECGTGVEQSVVYHFERAWKRFTLHTLSPAMRTLGFVFGLLGPAGIVLVAALDPMNPVNVEWQSGRMKDYIGAMLAGRAMYAFHPFLFWSYIAFGALLIRPLVMGRQWWVRAGLWLGCVLGVQYQLIIVGNLVGLGPEFVVTVLIGLIPFFIIAMVVRTITSADRKRARTPRETKAYHRAHVQIPLLILGVTILGLLTGGLVLIPILLAGPYLMLMFMAPALCRIYRTDFDRPAEPARPVPGILAGAGYAAAWPIAVTQAQIVYSSLPITPPGCYICSASARGHHWLTRPQWVRFADGSTRPVTRQMKTLKAAELLIADRYPRFHRVTREAYDRLGPRIASRIRSPWLADVSYLLFAVPAVIAGGILRLLGQQDRINRAYVGSAGSPPVGRE